MSVKSERITLLTTPDFKAFLNAEASKEGVSVAELIRVRCTRKPADNADEQELEALVGLLNKKNKQAADAMDTALKELAQTADYFRHREVVSA